MINVLNLDILFTSAGLFLLFEPYFKYFANIRFFSYTGIKEKNLKYRGEKLSHLKITIVAFCYIFFCFPPPIHYYVYVYIHTHTHTHT